MALALQTFYHTQFAANAHQGPWLQELLDKARRVLEHVVSLSQADTTLTAFAQRCHGLIACKVTHCRDSVPFCSWLPLVK